MVIRKATHQDVIDYMNLKYTKNDYKIQNGKLIIKYWINFVTYNFDTLPNNLVFNGGLDLAYTLFQTLPDDMVIKNSLCLDHAVIKTIPVLSVGINLDISDTDIVLKDGTYVGDTMFSSDSLYSHLHDLEINGYLFSTGVLS